MAEGSNRSRSEEMAEILVHEDYYETGSKSQKRFNEMRIERIRTVLGNTDGRRVVDIGIGEGFMVKDLGINDLWGVDLSSKRCSKARVLLPSSKLFVSDGKLTPFRDGSFDISICADVLEHVDRPEEVILELKRITRKGGEILISVPNENMLIIARMATMQFPVRNPDHIHKISKVWLEKRMGSRAVSRFNLPNLGYPLCVWQCYKFIN